VTGWSVLLIGAFVVLGLGRLEPRLAQRRAVLLVALVLTAVGIGKL
jgi:hypothetical protein